MNLLELKEWINNLPESELDDYKLVFRNIESVINETYIGFDVPIAACGIDDSDNKKLYFCNEKSSKLLNNETI